jgi:hypothetical protein
MLKRKYKKSAQTLFTHLRRVQENKQYRFVFLLAIGGVFLGVAFLFSLLFNTASTQVSEDPSLPIFRRSLLNRNIVQAAFPQVDMQARLRASGTDAHVEVFRNESAIAFAVPLTEPELEFQDSTATFTTSNKLIELEYNLQHNGIKEDITIFDNPQTNIFSTNVTAKNVTPHETSNQEIIFYNQDNEYQFHFEKPYAVDASGSKTYAVRYHLLPKDQDEPESDGTTSQTNNPNTNSKVLGTETSFTDLPTSFTTNLLGSINPIPTPEKDFLARMNPFTADTDEYRLVVEVDPTWLHAADRTYPVKIDPTIIHDESSDFATGAFNRTVDSGSGTDPYIEVGYKEISSVGPNSAAYFKFDHASSIQDSGPNNLTGTPSNLTTVPSLPGLGNARSFNGTNSQISIANSAPIQLTGSQTVAMWIYPTSLSVRRNPVNKSYGAELTITQEINGTLNYYWGTAGSNTTPYQAFNSVKSINLDTWNHIAVVRDLHNGRLRWYINGQLTNEADTAYARATASTAPLLIGNGYTNSYSGYIDDFYLAGEALNDEDIQNLMERRNSGTFTSSVIDLGPDMLETLDSIAWDVLGYATSDGETPSDTTDLIAQWNFNETSGTTLDASAGSCGSSCDGTLQNFSNTTAQDALAGSGWTDSNRRWGSGALMFNGTNNAVEIPNSASVQLTNDYTIETWIKRTGQTTPYERLISKSDATNYDYWLQISSNTIACGVLKVDATSYQAVSKIYVPVGEWQHVVCTLSATNEFKIYMNGTDVTGVVAGVAGPARVSTRPLQLGRIGSGGTFDYKFDGVMDSTRIYSRTLSKEEVASNYATSRVQLETRTSPDGSTWEEWRPVGNTTDITVTEWKRPPLSTQILTDTDSVIKAGSGDSMKIQTGVLPESEYIVEVFADTGAHTWTRPAGVTEVDLLVVGAGGGGGGVIGGGGGAGEVVYIEDFDVSSLPSASITVGAGGLGGNGWNTATQQGSKGEDTVFDSITADGGGSGGPYGGASVCNQATMDGASGGGAGANLISCIGLGTAGKGHDGGAGASDNNSGGGGGFLSQGGDGFNGSYSGSGGKGIVLNILDYERQYGSGGGGGTRNGQGFAGIGNGYSGGNGTTTTAEAQTGRPSTGSGGGGAGYSDSTSARRGGNGGHGAVIIRYPAPAPQYNHLAGYWKMDETGGTGAYIKDYSGNGNHGTPTGTSTVRGVVNQARSFEGGNHFTLIPATADLDLQTFTIEGWLHSVNFNQYGFIFEKTTNGSVNTQYSCFLAGNVLYFRTYNSAGAIHNTSINLTSTTMQNHAWNHFACVYDGSEKNILINGQLVASSNYTEVLRENPAGTAIIGAYGSGTGYFFNGRIDELKVHSVGLTDTEISEIYRLGAGQYLSAEIPAINLTSTDNLQFDIAADRIGTYLEVTPANSEFEAMMPDADTRNYWKFDDVGGRYLRDSGTSQDWAAVRNIKPLSTSGVRGGSAHYFSTASDWLDPMTNFDVDTSTTFTLSMWVKTNSTTTRGIFGFSNAQAPAAAPSNTPVITMLANGRIRAEAWNGGTGDITTTGSFNNNEWHQITFVAEGTNQKLYVNGEFIGERSGTIDLSWAQYAQIGAAYGTTVRGYAANGWSYYNGYLDEVRFDTVARTTEEIRGNYEAGRGTRSQSITIDFAAKLNSSNLIANSGDTSFTVNGLILGMSQPASNIQPEDVIIITENFNGTEYKAQGTVDTVNPATGAITVTSWDAGSTFPTGGYTQHANVAKWQREYLDFNKLTLDEYIDATTFLTFRFTNGSEGRNIWLDTLQTSSGSLTDPTGSVPTSTVDRYIQYKAIFTHNNPTISSALEAVSLDYTVNYPPDLPTLDAPTDTATSVPLAPTLQTTATDSSSDYLRYRIELCEDAGMSTNCQTFDQTSSQTGWSGQNAETSTAYSSGTQGSYTLQSDLQPGTTYYWKSQAIDPGGTNTWSSTQVSPYSFTTNYSPNEPTLNSPSDTATGVSLSPAFLTTTTDTDSDYLRYRIELCENVGMSTNCQTFDQTSSQTGWSGQNAQTSTAYTSGTQATYTYQGYLDPSTTYYWQSEAIDPAGTDTWSNTQATPYSFTTQANIVPAAPTGLEVNSTTNPIGVTTLTPTFRATFTDSDTPDTAASYTIQVSTNPTFSAVFAQWSGNYSPQIANGNQTPNVNYSGPTLEYNGQTYYWRIRYTDNHGGVGTWSSENATFTMADLQPPNQCTLNVNPITTQITVNWNDPNAGEDGYDIERIVNSGSWTSLSSEPANTTSYLDTPITPGNTYQYRVRATLGAAESAWCTTDELNPSTGNFLLEGLQLESLWLN